MTSTEVTDRPNYRVVNVRTYRGPHVYIGRVGRGRAGHPLANPYRLAPDADDEERMFCVANYREWLLARPDLDQQLTALREQTRNGELPLCCWCAPKICHGDVLAELLQAGDRAAA